MQRANITNDRKSLDLPICLQSLASSDNEMSEVSDFPGGSSVSLAILHDNGKKSCVSRQN